MKILKLKLYQETACYKKPFATKVAETYPLPPYSTVIGMFHKILQAQPGAYFPMNISVQGNYEGIFSNYQNLRMYKGKDKVTSMPRNVHQLLNVNLIIHVQAEDETIDKIYIIKHVEIPTTIVECGFLSNPDEEKLLLEDEYQNKLAWGIYNGIIDYFYQ